MTAQERYKRAISAVQPSGDYVLEGIMMKKQTRKPFRVLAAVCAVLVLTLGAASAAYAADLGGFRETVRLWINGEMAEATAVQDPDGGFTVVSGNQTIQFGGTVDDPETGVERPITLEEAVESWNSNPYVWVNGEGKLLVSYQGQTVDITEAIETDGAARITLEREGEAQTLYVKYDGDHGYQLSWAEIREPET